MPPIVDINVLPKETTKVEVSDGESNKKYDIPPTPKPMMMP